MTSWISRALLLGIVALIVVVLVANWLFSIKIEGVWISRKGGLDVWALWFEKGVYWYALLAYVVTFEFIGVVFAAWWGTRLKGVDRESRRPQDDFGWIPRRPHMDVRKWLPAVPLFFAFIGAVVGSSLAHTVAAQFLLVNGYIQDAGISWPQFLSEGYLRAVTYIMSGHYPDGAFLIANTVVFDFIRLMRAYVIPLLVLVSMTALFSIPVHHNWVKSLRNIMLIATIWYIYIMIAESPMILADISLPIHTMWRIATAVVLVGVTLSFTVADRLWRGTVPQSTRRTIMRSILVIMLIGLLLIAPSLQTDLAYHRLQDYEGNRNIFEFPYTIRPHIDYVKWADSLGTIQVANASMLTVPPPVEEEILRSIRVVSFTAAISQMQYAYGRDIGQPWMKLAYDVDSSGQITYGPMIVWSGDKEYWVLPTSPVLPEQSSQEVGARYQYTHSEVILAVDAATGEVVPISRVFPEADPTRISMYYGIGGLFKEQGMVFLRIGNWTETHMPGYKHSTFYDGEPDYIFGEDEKVLGFSERFRFFLLLQGNIQFATGGFGRDISVLMHRDVIDRVSAILIKGLVVENEPVANTPIPYLVTDPQGNIYYAFSVYIERALNTPYADTERLGQFVETSGDFRRPFAVMLVNTHDGKISGYRYGNWQENYITKFYGSFYGAWDKEMPDWLASQVRFPKSLMYRLIDLYNTYRIESSDASSWYKTLNMFDFPLGRDDYFNTRIDDIRYVPVFYDGHLQYAAVRIVEVYKQRSEQWTPRAVAGMFVFFGYGKELFIPLEKALPIQIILDSIRSQPDVQNILTTRRLAGQEWQEGNLLLYVVGNRPVYLLPYYAPSPSVLNVGMVVAADGVTGKVGSPYLLQDSKDPREIAAAPFRAYSLLGSGVTLSGEQQRIDAVKDELSRMGLEVRTPIRQPSANVEYLYANLTFRGLQDWDAVNSTLHNFVQDVLISNNARTVNVWTVFTGTTRMVYVGALVQTSQGVELHIITIALA